MRRLDQDELAWIGGTTILFLIMGVPMVTMIEVTNPIMDDWEQSILSEGKCIDNLDDCLVWFSVYMGRFFVLIPALKPLFILGDKLGVDIMPKRWEKYLKEKPKRGNVERE